jgi:hypothetical protein
MYIPTIKIAIAMIESNIICTNVTLNASDIPAKYSIFTFSCC